MDQDQNQPSSEQNQNQNQNQNQTQDQNQTQTPEDSVTLSKQELSDLLGSITELKTQLADVQKLPEDLPKPPEESPKSKPSDEPDYSKLSPQEIVDSITQTVSKTVGQPLLEMVMTLMVKEEIRECKSTYSDYDLYTKEMQAEAKNNPNLSIEQAYKLAKANNPDLAKKPKEETPKPPPFGEKPNSGSPATSTSTKLSVREAALQAINEIEKNS